MKFSRSPWLMLAGVLASMLQSAAAERVFTVAKDPSIVSHWPGPDGYLGTADDVVKNQRSRFIESSPNTQGSLGYLVTSLFGVQDDWLPGNNDTATFLEGTLTLETSSSGPNDIPKLKALQFSGTELFSGHGPYTVSLSNPRDGVYTRNGQEFGFTASFDFEGMFVSGIARSTNAQGSGNAFLIESSDFASDLPNPNNSDPMKAWINQVALPLARSLQPNAILCGKVNASTTGSNPGTPGSFPPLNAFGTFIAFEPTPSVGPSLKILSARLALNGFQIEWTPVAGRTYRIDSAPSVTGPYTLQARTGSETKFLDLSVAEAPQRFYRVVAE